MEGEEVFLNWKSIFEIDFPLRGQRMTFWDIAESLKNLNYPTALILSVSLI
jgi:hypothetical protein